MRYVKFVLLLAVCTIVMVMPISKVHADYDPALQCQYLEDPTSDGCDLAITKEVSVNNGAFTEATTADQAVSAEVGDTITWQVQVTNNSREDLSPTGTVTVDDTLPSGVTYVSSQSNNDSEYNETTGEWTFSVDDNLPATLTVVTTATSVGTFENVATLSGYVPDCYNEDPAYRDANSTNNSADAYVNIAAIPVVTPTAATVTPVAAVSSVGTPNTGFGVSNSNPWQALATYLVVATGIIGLAYASRRAATTKKN